MLCECIDSILKLNLQSAEREIIVVDDGSDQSPMNDLLKYGDDIIYVRQKNGGVSVARNTAMDMAKGQFIQIVDGDDCLLTVPYEQCLDIIRKNGDADVVMFDFTHQNSQGSNSPVTPPEEERPRSPAYREYPRSSLLLSVPTSSQRPSGLHPWHRLW